MSKSTLASNTDSGETRSERAETAAPEGKDSLEQPYLSAGPRLLPIPGQSSWKPRHGTTLSRQIRSAPCWAVRDV